LRRRPWIIGVAAAIVGVLAGVVAVGFVMGPRLQSPAQAVADATPPPATPVTVAVESRVLAEELVLRGRVERQPGTGVTVPIPSTVSPVVTAVPLSVGDRLLEGDLLVELAGRPVIVLEGDFPAYRDLTGGLEGPDVVALQEALVRLGYENEVDSVFGRETQSALTTLYADRGYEPTPGLPDAAKQIKSARQQVEDAKVEARAASGADPTQARAASLAVERAEDNLNELLLTGGPSLPASEVIYLDQLPRTISSVLIDVGDTIAPEEPAFELDAAAWLVTATLPTDRLELVAVGDDAVAIDELSDTEYPLVISRIGGTSESEDEESGIPIEFEARETLPDAEGKTLRLVIEGQSTGDPVLAVPVSAVFSRSDGSRYVTVMADDDSLEDVDVNTGLVISGWVEIVSTEGESLDVGDEVLVGFEAGLLRPAGDSDG